MIRAIRRAFDIVEFLARRPDAPRTITEIAEGAGIPVATCGRILETLAACDYVEQLPRRGGFALGPMAFALASRGPYRKDLVRAAETEMDRFARRVNETVVLVALHRGKRFELCSVEGERGVQVRNDAPQHERIYETATGRALLAWLPPDERALAVERNGSPGKAWPEANTKGGMERELERIRDEAQVTVAGEEHIVYLAQPVFEGDRAVAAVGVYLPRHRFDGAHKAEVVEGLDELAKAITVKLTNRFT